MIRHIKKYFILITVLLFLPKQVFGVWGVVESGLISAMGSILNFLINITGMLAAASGSMLVAVTDGSLIQFSYTNPATNAVVAAGLSVTQGLANGFLVIVLVFISISVALKMEGYGGQKLFINLILAALLVNFAPILVGVVVDAANIVMGFFLQGVSDGLSYIGGGLIQAEGMGIQTVSIADYSAGVAIIQIGLNIFIAFILALFSILFLVRWFAIWIITILSPIAVLAWIHPYTKSIWKQWLQQLVQWSFVGVTAGFFLFLGMKTNEVMLGMVYEEVTMGGTVLAVEPGFLSFLGRIIPFMAVAIFFGMAFVMGLGTSAMGADKVIGYAEHKRKQAQRYVGQRVKKQYEGGKEWTKEKRTDFIARQVSRPGIQKFAQRMTTMETPGSREQGLGGWAKRQTAPIFGAIRSVGRKASTDVVRNEKDIVSAEQKRAESMSSKEKSSAYQSAQTDAKRLGIIAAAHASGEIKDLMESIGERVKSDLPNIFKVAERTGKNGEVSLAFSTEYLRSQDKRGGKTDEQLRREGKTDEQIVNIRKDEKGRGVKTNEELLREVEKMSDKDKGGKTDEQIIADIRKKDEEKYYKEVNKLSSRMRRKPENIQRAAESIAKNILEGETQAFDLVFDVIEKGKPSHIQSLIDNTEKGRESVEKTLDKHYKSLEHSGVISGEYSGWNIDSEAHKRYVALHRINPGMADRIGKGIQELIMDVESPEKRKSGNENDSGLVDRHGRPFS